MNLFDLIINHPGRNEVLQYYDKQCNAATPPSKGGENLSRLFHYKKPLSLTTIKSSQDFLKSPQGSKLALYSCRDRTGVFNLNIIFIFLLLPLVFCSCSNPDLIISCREDNDLYITLKNNNISCGRYDSPAEAIRNARKGSGVLILADGYPGEQTPVSSEIYSLAREKNLRLFVEYPSYIPGIETGQVHRTQWERAVVSSSVFEPSLSKFRILAINDCHFIPIDAVGSDIVIARVAGFDSAVYGLPEKIYPVLTEINTAEGLPLLVSTTKLSQFISGRYAPSDAWQTIWIHILRWVQPGAESPELIWESPVKPAYRMNEPLPSDFEKVALRKGIEWYRNSGMIVNEDMQKKYSLPANLPEPAKADPDTTVDWPFGHRVGFPPDPGQAPGDGSLGVLEGFDAKIFFNGRQPARWWRRGDCNGEIAGALSLAGMALNDTDFLKTGSNVADWLFFKSMISLGDRSDPDKPDYGLSGWNDVPEYCGPGSIDGYGVYYGDDNARVVLGMMLAAAAQDTDRYDKRLLSIILGNLRISGKYGFQPNRIDHDPLNKAGWKYFFNSESVSFSPHYQANIWACYLWAYNQTGDKLFLYRARKAISMTMAAYPDKWIWTNGIQQERAKMLLPLAWLVRTEDTGEHREWLRKMAGDLLAEQSECGAIPEELGGSGKGGFPPPASNEAYGTSETPLIQTNDDKVSDMLYTVNFAFLGLHEAAAATGDGYYKAAEDKLASFLCRIQIKSEKHPELDGAWFRAFDFKRWEYWASNGDAGWGAWSVESGWTQSWITSVLALRQLNTSVWDITKDSRSEVYFEELKREMFQ